MLDIQNAHTSEEKEFSINSHDKRKSVRWKMNWGKYYNYTQLGACDGEKKQNVPELLHRVVV